MSRHPQREPPPGYEVLRSWSDLPRCRWRVLHRSTDGYLHELNAAYYTRRYNAVAAAWRIAAIERDYAPPREQPPDRVE